MVEKDSKNYLYIRDYAEVSDETEEVRNLLFGHPWQPSILPEQKDIPKEDPPRHPRSATNGSIRLIDENN